MGSFSDWYDQLRRVTIKEPIGKPSQEICQPAAKTQVEDINSLDKSEVITDSMMQEWTDLESEDPNSLEVSIERLESANYIPTTNFVQCNQLLDDVIEQGQPVDPYFGQDWSTIQYEQMFVVCSGFISLDLDNSFGFVGTIKN